ncbi:hypothetical protein JCM8097_000415 [Rhodosporidiobolus ruineniae]
MAPSPPKPWERTGTAPAAAASSLAASPASTTLAAGAGTAASAIAPATTSTTPTAPAGAPALPDRPATMTQATTTGYGATGSALTTSPYGATTSSYGSPYSRFGSTGYGGGYGGYGSSYGSYGGYGSSLYGGGGMYGSSMYGGYGGGMYGGGPMGMMGAAGGMYGPGEMSLSQRMESGTAATFQILQSLVGAVGGFAQMLESTFMATHSSFFAMIGVAEQFGHLRNYLGQVLSVFALLRWCKALLYRLVGKTPPGEGLTAEGFRAFEAGGGGGATGGGANAAGGPAAPKMSKRPLVVFFLTVIGLPWLMNRLVRLITARQEAEAARLGLAVGQQPQFDALGRPLPPTVSAADQAAALDPSQLTFVRALYPYAPPPHAADKELAFGKDDILAILAPSKEERAAQAKAAAIEGGGEGGGGAGAGTWWMGRKRDGTTGWFPSTYVRELPMNGTGAGATGKKDEAVKA